VDMQSASIKEITAALVQFQRSARPVVKDHVNPHFKSRYADLSDCWQAVREPLAANGLAVIQATTIRDGQTVMVTTLAHTSGEWFRGEYPVTPIKADPQSLASAHTYARRYSLTAILGLTATDDDDDGNAAAAPPRTAERPQTAPNGNQARGKAAMAVGKSCSDLLASATLADLRTRWQEIDATLIKQLAGDGFTDLIAELTKAKDSRKAQLSATPAGNFNHQQPVAPEVVL
jgi:hypothetical protein